MGGSSSGKLALDIGRQRLQQKGKYTYMGQSGTQNPMEDLMSRIAQQLNQYNAERNLMFGGEGYAGSFQNADQQAARAAGGSLNAKPYGGWGGYGSQNPVLSQGAGGQSGGTFTPGTGTTPGGGVSAGPPIVTTLPGNPNNGPGTSVQVNPKDNPIFIDTIPPKVSAPNPLPGTPSAPAQTSGGGTSYTPPPGYVPIGGPGGGSPEDYYTSPAATGTPTKTQVSGLSNQTAKPPVDTGTGTTSGGAGPSGGGMGNAPTGGPTAMHDWYRTGSASYRGGSSRAFNEADPYLDVSQSEAASKGLNDPNMVYFKTKRLGYGLPSGIKADAEGYFAVPKSQASQFAASNFTGKTDSFLDPYKYSF